MTEKSRKTILEKSRKILCYDDDDYAILKEVILSKRFEEFADKCSEEKSPSVAEFLTRLYIENNFQLQKWAEGKTEERLRIYIPLSAYKANEDIAAVVNSNPNRYALYESNESKYGYTLYIVNGKRELERI